MNVTRVLVVEDDTKVASFIQKGLEQEGLAVDVLNDGEDAGAQAQIVDYDCVVLDLLLPGRSGFQVLRDIRSRKADLPVLILSAQASPEARVAGLNGGADDYMDKPFILAEVSARIRALLRRGKPRDTKLRVSDLEVDTVRRRVTRAGQPIDLKPKEYALLEFLVHNWDRPVTRSHIIEHVWDIHFDSISNVVEVHINSLRNKIDRGAPTPLIHTIRGVGYMLSDKSPSCPLYRANAGCASGLRVFATLRYRAGSRSRLRSLRMAPASANHTTTRSTLLMATARAGNPM